jgi:hypothetical protein
MFQRLEALLRAFFLEPDIASQQVLAFELKLVRIRLPLGRTALAI